MTKNTKNYVCSRIQQDTFSNLGKALELLTRVTNDEHFYNYEISDSTHKMRMELTEIFHQVRKELTKKIRTLVDNIYVTKLNK